MNKVVSYALFAHASGGSWKTDGTPGKLDGYIRYLPIVLRAHHALWPNWRMVLHHDRAVANHRYFPALQRMQDHGLIRLVDCGTSKHVGWGPMWRFMPAFETTADVVLCHDIDSFPSLTLRRCADEFVASPHTAAVVHGCESHTAAMAGLFFLRSARFRELVGVDDFDVFMRQRAYTWDWYGADEHYLRDIVWPKLEAESMLFRLGANQPSVINSPNVRRELTIGMPTDVDSSVLAVGNSFAPYPGAAGMDRERAMDFFEALDLPALVLIRRAENGVATGREISRL